MCAECIAATSIAQDLGYVLIIRSNAIEVGSRALTGEVLNSACSAVFPFRRFQESLLLLSTSQLDDHLRQERASFFSSGSGVCPKGLLAYTLRK